MPLPPLNRLWKGITFFAFLLFILFCLTFFKVKPGTLQPEEEPPRVQTEICLLVTSTGPVNVDTVFRLKSERIFAYSSWSAGFADTVWHTWFHNSEMMQNIPCKQENSACFSSISADSLQEGNWSVDTRQNGILLNIKQFRIEK